ncbi:phosphocholine cytidylyltransferase family protein [Myxococcota bacterium]|nr:phosphocholine cytidylyltransferase family protein [Myxococcota bacterium]
MRAIVLSAGQGKRLLPLTESRPKCLLPLEDGELTLLELQLRTLAGCGIRQATVMVGFGADQVEAFLDRTSIPGIEVETVFNPFYAVSDNLISCWLAGPAMAGDCLLLNGDTVFEPRVLERLLEANHSISVTIDRKTRYDDDDMKVTLEGNRLIAIGKQLPHPRVHAESIGLLAFRGDGAETFRTAVQKAVRHESALRAWYLSVVDELSRRSHIHAVDIQGLWWREVDDRADLDELVGCIRDGRTAGA